MSLIFAPPPTVPELLDEASVSPTDDDAVKLTSTSQLHLLFKVDCCLEDVNVFTLSNLAGKSFLDFEQTTILACYRLISQKMEFRLNCL